MQINPGDGSGIIDDISFLLGNGINLSNYSIQDRIRNINLRASMVWSSIFESYGGWLFMDDNTSDNSSGLPYADQAISANQGLYQLPSTALTVIGVEIKYVNGTTWIPMRPLTHEQFLDAGGDAAFPTSSTPWAYMAQGDILRLLPAANYTQSASLRVFFDAEMQLFLITDTSKTPGFASPFHRMLSVGAALDYAESHGMTSEITTLSNKWNDLDKRLRNFYSNRFKAMLPHRITPGEDLVDEFS